MKKTTFPRLPRSIKEVSVWFQYSSTSSDRLVLGNLDNGNGGAAHLFKTDGTFIKELNMVDTECKPRRGGLTDYCTFAKTGTKVAVGNSHEGYGQMTKTGSVHIFHSYHRRI